MRAKLRRNFDRHSSLLSTSTFLSSSSRFSSFMFTKVVQTDGNAMDVCSFAAYSALKCTHIPKTEVFIGESGRPEDFEVSGEIIDAVLFEPSSLPLCVTVTKVGSKCCRYCCCYCCHAHYTTLHSSYPHLLVTPYCVDVYFFLRCELCGWMDGWICIMHA